MLKLKISKQIIIVTTYINNCYGGIPKTYLIQNMIGSYGNSFKPAKLNLPAKYSIPSSHWVITSWTTYSVGFLYKGVSKSDKMVSKESLTSKLTVIICINDSDW